MSTCAIKALSGQALKDDIERASFRRGVESLYFLNRENKKVAPSYLFHTNVPMAVAMEYVEGASLANHMESNQAGVQGSWLSVSRRIAESLIVCHTSEGGVLHRDLKPQNIIFEGAYEGCDLIDLEGANVRFINFDMSWHKLSAGNTKNIPADEIGFYAPEQRNFINSDSPRTAKTDVYMLGITMLFILSGATPPDGGAQRENWDQYVRLKTRPRLGEKLVSERIARLIILMTMVDPDSRPDLRTILTDLEMVELAIKGEWAKVDSDLFVERILAESGYDYKWSDERVGGQIITPRQIELSLSFIQKGNLLQLSFLRQRDDGSDRKNFGGRLGQLIGQVKSKLSDLGWQTDLGGGHYSRSIEARIPIRELTSNPTKSISSIKGIIDDLMKNIG